VPSFIFDFLAKLGRERTGRSDTERTESEGGVFQEVTTIGFHGVERVRKKRTCPPTSP
jgi:hypothetical protein